MDPILAYLLELNKHTAIEYTDRYLVPAGGLAKMLRDFKEFHLNKVEVVKSELLPAQSITEDLDTLMGLID